ncbi:hypothetical protein RDWZM_008326 [Blomia tropicalis]|uniref:Uncharacterized protein n=1 Tax=Blomia tropicalis TaxID=40697 RepID=A0A9Q0M164_BLOTA|nr:hypothetical protein BLOT_004120 [Blomia tropicalis]KAJ6217169.1 hypothetical protein RDWZM_008326 [Blomia tropicalis]
MSSPLNESTFKEISIVPDYRALEIIIENKKEFDEILESDEPILKAISKNSDYIKYRAHLKDVENYLTKKIEKIPQLNSDVAKTIFSHLNKHFGLDSVEVVMILNQLPLTDSLLEMMFPGKFNKEQLSSIVFLIESHINIPKIEIEES